jgi:hypothetical protein
MNQDIAKEVLSLEVVLECLRQGRNVGTVVEIHPSCRKAKIYLYPTLKQAKRLFAIRPPSSFLGEYDSPLLRAFPVGRKCRLGIAQ